MQVAALSTVRHRLQPGAPLPFNVRNADKTLLLARGHLVETAEQLQALFERGALVDIAELVSPRDRVQQASRAELPGLWQDSMHRVGHLLFASAEDRFAGALDEATAPMQALVERDPELAIFQVLRQGGSADLAYGAQRSLQTAVTGLLVAQRLGWESAQCQRLFKVALTMNISMLELQGQLARQLGAPTPEQRHDLQTHPMRSVRILEQAGISDRDWLHAVLCHHEEGDGSGYPSGHTGDIGDLATLARRADIYSAKLSARASRDAMAADLAGRHMFMQDPGHPMTAALVREFGIYPPGCYVRLVSGELAIVVARGASITSPVVACLTNERGMPVTRPERRETGDKAHAVACVVGERSVPQRLPMDRLAALVAA
jgi:HD-GYP domain-containing protein (c-di-GMP phosphodiesterase class II)